MILTILEKLLSVKEFYISSRTEAWAAYYDYEVGNADFSDYFIAQLNKKFGCEVTVSFDKKAAQHTNFKLLAVKLN
ncbi:hypothetical protein [Methylomagnum sp.]